MSDLFVADGVLKSNRLVGIFLRDEKSKVNSYLIKTTGDNFFHLKILK